MREFLRPLPLLAVIVMAVNDHVLKQRYPGWLTGKLSDFAICFFLPIYVAAILDLITRWSRGRRVAIGAAATAVLFIGIKTSVTFAALWSAFMSAITTALGMTRYVARPDVSDLIALPFIALAAWYVMGWKSNWNWNWRER